MSATIVAPIQRCTDRHPHTPNRGRAHRRSDGHHDAFGSTPSRSRERTMVVAPRRVSEATFRRRRMIAGTALAVFVAVGAVTAHDVLAGSGGVPASAAESQPARSVVVARPGDSLWAIADRFHGEVSITRYVDKLVSLNGGASIEAGQAITLP